MNKESCNNIPNEVAIGTSCQDIPDEISDLSKSSGLNLLALNFDDGESGTIMQDVLQYVLRRKKTHETYIKRREEARVVQKRLADALENVKLTGGALFKVGHVVLCKDVLLVRKERDINIHNKSVNAIKNSVDRYNKRLEDYKKIIFTHKNETTYTMAELSTWLRVRKRKADGKFPTTRLKMWDLYEVYKDREPLSLRDYLIDEGKDVSMIGCLLK